MTSAEQLRDAGMAQATEHADPRVVLAIDAVILAAIATGKAFTADDIRSALPTVTSPGLVGARMRSFAGRKPMVMQSIGYVRSTHPATRRAVIRIWVGTAHGKRVAG